jgi:MraZ protein
LFKGFLGTFTPRMDDKGRVTLPVRYREDFAPGIMIVSGQDHCLYLFTPEGFEEFAQDAINAPVTDKSARGYQRYMFSNTDDQRPDGQGRISIPARMREYAGLTKDVVIAGVGKRMEVWDAAEWARYEAAQEAAYASPSEGVLRQN